MQRFMVSRRALRSITAFNQSAGRRALASVSPTTIRESAGSTPHIPPTSLGHLRNSPSHKNHLASYRLDYPRLDNASYIRFNPSSNPSFADQKAVDEFIASLQSHFDDLPADPHAPASAARFRQYSRAFVIPFEDGPQVYWAPGHPRGTEDITYYNQGTSFTPDAVNFRH